MTDRDAVLAANAAYYRAFRAGDARAMEDVWADEDVTCVHPGWPLLEGREAVMKSWRRILENPAQDAVTRGEERVVVTGDVARVHCEERVAGATLAATNLFARTPDGWRLVHHHASLVAARFEPAPKRRLN